MIHFRFRYAFSGGHAHVRVFAGAGQTLGLCGKLVMRLEEFDKLRLEAERPGQIDFIEEGVSA